MTPIPGTEEAPFPRWLFPVQLTHQTGESKSGALFDQSIVSSSSPPPIDPSTTARQRGEYLFGKQSLAATLPGASAHKTLSSFWPGQIPGRDPNRPAGGGGE